MATFAELRERLSLDGKQFERVCKWFLETDPRYSDRLVNVWLWDDWPGRWGPDCGIDLVAEDRDGKNWAIQAKCYDPKYSVTKNDVDKFLSESTNEDIHHRLLIATTDNLGKNARGVIHRGNKVIPVSQLLLHDLEAAPVDWPANPNRPKGGGPRKPVKRWPHQTQAINNVTKNLGKRGQMISACGTGKTLAALWISERLEAKRTLVLLPSLTLLSQTVSEWLANTKEPFAYLPVCSDDTVSRGNDAAVMFTSDLEYPVTTDPDDIATFLRKRGRQVVFSTYQSSHRIAEAQTRNRVPGFDLVIADEAHRCAGKVSSAYGTVLDDEAIRAKRRLFMTATPRTYTAKVQKKALEADIEVASMDDEAVFGPVVHQLNFGEAIERGLLTDYQVVVIGVDDSRYQQMVDERRIVKADKHIKTDAETLAKHVAVAKAIRDYSLRRTITFHSRIKTASAFANLLPEVVSWMPPRHRPKVELLTDHVSGEMSTGERNRRLNRLRSVESGQSAVLTNAGCLSEGIDVPALDGVAFIDPRRSQVDIVQAVGRAIRRSPNKTVGTIVIPVFLPGTDDPDTALSQSEFEPVWSIVRALRSHDDALGEALDGIRISMGRKGGGSGLPPKIVTDIPKGVSADFVDAFRTRLVEATSSSWDFGLGVLQRFVAREGHSRVRQGHVEVVDGSQVQLGQWCATNRYVFGRGELSLERVAALEALPGWEWDPIEANYQRSFRALEQFVAREGHARVLAKHQELFDGEEIRLGGWVSTRRGEYTRGRLSLERSVSLEALPGWAWDSAGADLQHKFGALEQFVAREGHARVPAGHREVVGEGEIRLGNWVNNLRARNRRGDVPPALIVALEGLPGWVWDPYEHQFQLGLAAVHQFVAREGHCRPPEGHVEIVQAEAVKIPTWIAGRRADFRRGQLSSEQVGVIEAIPGWQWDPVAAVTRTALAALEQFVAREGHSRVRRGHVEVIGGEDFRLGGWVTNRRTDFGNGRLPPELVAELEALPHWAWSGNEADYRRGFEALEQFVAREGHSRVSRGHVEVLQGKEIKLGSWIGTRRMEFRNQQLSPERVAEFEALSAWEWDPIEADYQRSFRALEQFVAREGHARVPTTHREVVDGEEIRLGFWCSRQRHSQAKGNLSQDEAIVFESLPGWEWHLTEGRHRRSFEALEQFVAREGHSRVPVGHVEVLHGEEIKLGGWVGQRRSDFAEGVLSTEHAAALEAVPGWIWNTNEAEYQLGFIALEQFVAREGHARVSQKHTEVVGTEPVRLGSWVSRRRGEFHNDSLSTERTSALEALVGWTWNPMEAELKQKAAALSQFVAREKHARVPQQHVELFDVEEVRLGSWVSSRRSAYKEGRLSADEVTALEALPGWVWDTKQASWEQGYSSLVRFAEVHGHARPTANFVDATGYRLGSWVSVKRQTQKKGRLPADQVTALQALPGWVWSVP